jgi:5-methylcytosine-specific restriction endonuclease McrA
MKRNYNDIEYEKCRKNVLKRDKRKCQMPGCSSKSKLHVHHIKPWSKASSLRYDENNCITLCKTCHESIKDKEHHYESMFIEILNNA